MQRTVLVALSVALLHGSASSQGLFREVQGLPLPAGKVRVVAGGAAYASIQAAIDAADEGDTVLVQSGLYGGFTIDGRSLAVIAEVNALVAFEPGAVLSVRNLGPDQMATLRGLGTAGSAMVSLEAVDDLGLVWIEDCQFRSRWLDQPPAGLVTGCVEVVLVDCAFVGGDSETTDVHGLSVVSSALWMYDSSVTTGLHFGRTGSRWITFGQDGASALAASGSTLFASGCAFTGGSASTFEGYCFDPGGAGPALALDGSHAQTLDCAIVSGIGYEADFGSCIPVLGPPVELVASTHVVLPGSAHLISVQGVAREGALVEIQVAGEAGELAFLHDTSEPSPSAFPGFTGPLFTLAPAQILPLGTLPAGGALSIESVVGTLARWRESLLVFTQGIFLGGPGASFAGEPSAVLVLDASIPAVFPDCDGNGMDDVADIAAGAPDCNANGVPDACDVALGTSPDCDRNGVPDACDDVREIEALSPSQPQGITLRFGWSVDLSGDTAIATANTNDPAIQAVYVYERDPLLGWPALETRRLFSSDPSLALFRKAYISGDTIVATPLLYMTPYPNNIGPTHVWVRDPLTGWPATETQQLETSDPGDVLEEVLGIDGRTIACLGLDQGVSGAKSAVFVYERNPDGSWPATETAIIHLTSLSLGPTNSAVSEDVIAFADVHRQVLVFERSPQGTWPASQTAVLTSPQPYGDSFGSGIDLDGDTIVVGATTDDSLVWRSGSVYVFRRAALGWSIEALLKASTPQPFDYFGSALALQGDALVVCALSRDSVQSGAGSAVLFRRDGGQWREEAEFAPSSLSIGAGLGGLGSAALDGSLAVIGTPGDSSTPYLGSVTLFELLDADANGVPDACE